MIGHLFSPFFQKSLGIFEYRYSVMKTIGLHFERAFVCGGREHEQNREQKMNNITNCFNNNAVLMFTSEQAPQKRHMFTFLFHPPLGG